VGKVLMCMKKCCLTSALIVLFAFPSQASAEEVLASEENNGSEVPVFLPENTMENIDPEDFPLTDFMAPTEDTTSVGQLSANELLSYIESYDISQHFIVPKLQRVITPSEVLDYPRMSPLFMPLVFNSVHRKYSLDPRIKTPVTMLFRSVAMDSLRTVFASDRYISRLAQKILQDAESKQINRIHYSKSDLPSPEKLVYQLDSKKPPVWVKPIASMNMENPDTKALPKNKFNPWSRFGYCKFQFSQTYNSPNWSKGGESNMAGLINFYWESDYEDSKNIAFDNYVEIKVGVNTVTSDSLRKVNISTDQLKAVSKLGLKMYNDLYYSLSGEFSTQFLENYKANTWTKTASLMSPAKLFVGLGVDYKKTDKKKGYNLSLLVTPLTWKANYLYDIKNMTPSSYGIEDGKHFGSEFGCKLTANLTWTFSEQVKWTSKFYYYTDFTYVDSEWENTLDLSFNNYFTTSIFVHLKADDRLERDPGEPLLQMKELLSFGLVYRW
jgi:hypothetical protein